MQKSELMLVALEAAKQAEEVIMKYYAGEIKVDIKPDYDINAMTKDMIKKLSARL